MSRDIVALFAKIQLDFSKAQASMERVAEAFRRLQAANHPAFDPPALPAHLAIWENEGGAL